MFKAYIRHKISPGEIHNLSDKESDVLRKRNDLKIGDPISLHTPIGVFLGSLAHVDSSSVEVEVLNKLSDYIDRRFGNELKIQVLQSILDNDSMSYALSKMTEIGATEVIPINTHYSQETKTPNLALQKWERVIRESKLQSLRQDEIILAPISKLTDRDFPSKLYKQKLCFTTENISTQLLSEIMKEGSFTKAHEFSIAIGPSKGWAGDELDLLKRAGFHMISLGDTILRAESVGITVISALKYHLGLL